MTGSYFLPKIPSGISSEKALNALVRLGFFFVTGRLTTGA